MNSIYQNEYNNYVNTYEKICYLNSNKMIVIELDKDKRKLLHEYFDFNHPNIYHSSLRSEFFETDIIRFLQCPCCDCKNVPVLSDNYHYGYEYNNKDESYSCECPDCDEYFSWEPNYDCLDFRVIPLNNVICFSNYFKNYDKSKYSYSKNIEKVEVCQVLNESKFYIVKVPLGNLNKKKLGEFITHELSTTKV